VSKKPETSIHFAVTTCLARCRLSDAPLTTLADFSNELRDSGWDAQSVTMIEQQVLGELAKRDALGRHTIVVTPAWKPNGHAVQS
jgi:hypothetical protein